MNKCACVTYIIKHPKTSVHICDIFYIQNVYIQKTKTGWDTNTYEYICKQT